MGLKSFGTKSSGAYFCTPKNEVDLVAQLVEHNTFNVGALGSSPSGITKKAVERRLFYFNSFTRGGFTMPSAIGSVVPSHL